MGACKGPAFLDGVVEHGKGGGAARGADADEAQALEDLAHAVAHGGGGGQGEVHDPKGNLKGFGHFTSDELAHAGHLAGGALDDLGNLAEAKVGILFNGAVDGFFHHAGAADAHVDDGVGFTGSEVGAGHKGDVFGDVAEDAELGRRKAIQIGGEFGPFFDGFGHEKHGVHVDAGPCGAYVHRGADAVGFGEGFGDRFDEGAVAVGDAFLHQGGKPADEVHAHLLGNLIQSDGDLHHLLGVERGCHHTNGADRDALVHHLNAVFIPNGVAGGHVVFGKAGDFFSNVGLEGLKIA